MFLEPSSLPSAAGPGCHTCGKGGHPLASPQGRPFQDALRHFAFYRQENSARRFGIFLRIMYHGSLKMLELIFPFLSLIDAPDIWVKEPRPQPCSWGGRNVSAQAVVSCYRVNPVPSSLVLPAHVLLEPASCTQGALPVW